MWVHLYFLCMSPLWFLSIRVTVLICVDVIYFVSDSWFSAKWLATGRTVHAKGIWLNSDAANVFFSPFHSAFASLCVGVPGMILDFSVSFCFIH